MEYVFELSSSSYGAVNRNLHSDPGKRCMTLGITPRQRDCIRFVTSFAEKRG